MWIVDTWKLALGILVGLACAAAQPALAAGIVFEGQAGPGKGKHIVLVTGDEEYRSEESMPQLAKILAERHGFKCTVLFAINPQTGEVDPMTLDNIPGLEALDTADLMVLFTRFRELPDAQMKHIVDHVNSGRPVVSLRTATHPFAYKKHLDSPYAKYDWRNKEYQGGFGRQILGETWVNHHGHHNHESTRGLVAPGMKNCPIVRGCEDIWGPSDVYGITTLTGDARSVIMGQVLKGMDPKDEPNTAKAQMPIAWTKTFTGTSGKAARIFATTMGHAGDLKSEGFRRLLVNACYWAVGMESQIPARANVDIVGTYDPLPIGYGKCRKGLKPADFK
jgi:type 1 glutamine amidotransferase